MTRAVAEIRPYQPQDRSTLRQICCDTADAGQPVERFFPDREVIADLLTNYYTQYEPEFAYVAENNGGVVGYLTGCLDTRRFKRAMAWQIVPAVFGKALFRGVLWHPQAVRFVRANLGIWLKGEFRNAEILREYPAHLHVNIREGFRDQRLGERLVEAFCNHARRAGAPGIHAGVSAENTRAGHFFEELGFAEVHREPRCRSQDGTGRVLYTIIYGKKCH
ncbi:MAG TPA: GNAT family N-acetyltransferase [Verrucomicrobiae bacterium]|nr:GNAT family N-acetyltransferase [Verrucomicrobiae bacterium]